MQSSHWLSIACESHNLTVSLSDSHSLRAGLLVLAVPVAALSIQCVQCHSAQFGVTGEPQFVFITHDMHWELRATQASAQYESVSHEVTPIVGKGAVTLAATNDWLSGRCGAIENTTSPNLDHDKINFMASLLAIRLFGYLVQTKRQIPNRWPTCAIDARNHCNSNSIYSLYSYCTI